MEALIGTCPRCKSNSLAYYSDIELFWRCKDCNEFGWPLEFMNNDEYRKM